MLSIKKILLSFILFLFATVLMLGAMVNYPDGSIHIYVKNPNNGVIVSKNDNAIINYLNTTTITSNLLYSNLVSANTYNNYFRLVNLDLGGAVTTFRIVNSNNGSMGIGRSTMQQNTGQYNSALGYASLSNNAGANQNTAIGAYTLENNIEGLNNTALGYQALRANNASYNVAIGHQAMLANTTGEYNNAIGNASLDGNTTGTSNTTMGHGSLGQNRVGNRNNALGWNALWSNVSGNDNIGIGFNAGKFFSTSSQMTSMNNSIYIGNDTKGSKPTENNVIVIGTNAIGLGDNTTVIGNTSTTLTQLYGTVSASALIINGSVVANSFAGNGAGLTNINASNITNVVTTGMTVNTANYALTMPASGLTGAISVNASVANNTIVISSNGYVGIGAIKPSANLHISSGTNGDTELIIEADTDNNNEGDNARLVFVQDGGFRMSAIGTGILTPNLDNLLIIANGISKNIGVGNGGIAFSTAVGASSYSSANIRMLINSSGNISIGRSPYESYSERLSIIGNTNTAVLSVQAVSTNQGSSPTTTDALYIDKNGNVGIGTAAPVYALDVSGTANISKALFVNGMYVGNRNGASNVAVGPNALTNNVGSNFNTALGNSALLSNISGQNNVGVGPFALQDNVNGDYNVAIGHSALKSNLVDHNIAIGGSSLAFNTTGTRNVALGSSTLYGATTSNANTAIGFYAISRVSGDNNVALGSYAGAYPKNGSGTNYLTNANDSVFIGANTKANANNDTNSIVIGTGATGLGSNTTVIGNTNTTLTQLYGTVSASAGVFNGTVTANNFVGNIFPQYFIYAKDKTITDSVDAPTIYPATFTTVAGSSVNGAMKVMAYDDTVSQNAFYDIYIPENATVISIDALVRMQTSSLCTINLAIVSRIISRNGGVGIWGATTNIATSFIMENNALWKTITYNASLSTLGLIAGNYYQIAEFRFRDKTNTPGNLYWYSTRIRFR